MAVTEDNGIAPGSAGMNQQAPQVDMSQRQNQSQSESQFRPGARNLNSLLSRPFSKSAINETLQVLSKTFNEFIANEIEQHDLGFRVLVIDSKHSLTALSAIAVCYNCTVAGKDYVAVHTMVVSGGTKLSNRTIQHSGQNVEIVTVPGDVADAELRKRVLTIVTETYNNRNIRVLECASNVIHDEVDVTDNHQLRVIFANAIQACWHGLVIENVKDEAPFNASVIGKSDSLVAYVDMHPQAVKSSSNLPVRSDVSVQLQAVVQQSSQSQPEQVVALTQVDGFVDLVYVPPQQQQQMVGWGQPMMMNTQRYCPRFVITNFASAIDASSMELQLLALASSQILIESISGAPQWMNTFKPRPAVKGEIDKRDIGAVGLEVNFTNDPNTKPTVIDTKSNGFGTQDLYKMINMACYPNLIYSLDVEEVGDMSYLNMPFIMGSMDHARSLEIIGNAANNLTNNSFQRCWLQHTAGSAGEKFFWNDDNRIFIGYYVDKDGIRRDLRDFDYLAILNILGRNNQSFIKEWSDTFDRRDIPLEIRMDRRRRIYESIMPGNVTIKGYARRVTMNPKFMAALTQACKESGLVFRPSNLNTEYNIGTEHGIANAHQMGVAPSSSGLFAFGGGQVGVQSGMNFNVGFNGMGRNW